MSRRAESVYGIDLNHIFKYGYKIVSWFNEPTMLYHKITLTHIDNLFTEPDTTCYIKYGFNLPEDIKRFVDGMIRDGEEEKMVHFSFELPGVHYFQSLYLNIKVEEYERKELNGDEEVKRFHDFSTQ